MKISEKITSKYNKNILKQLVELRDLIKYQNTFEKNAKIKLVNSFRLRSYNYAIKIIENLNYKIKSEEDLIHTGIGKGLQETIMWVLENPSKELPKLIELKKLLRKQLKNKPTIDQLTSIVGIGDKLAIKLINDFKIKSITDLKKKIQLGEFKANDKILLGIKYYGKYEMNIPRNEVTEIYKKIIDTMNAYDPNIIIYICGSYRRKKEFCNDIDVIITHKNYEKQDKIIKTSILKAVISLLKKNNLIIDDITDKNYITKYMGFCKYGSNPPRRIDIRLFAKETLPTALTYYTGSYEFNRKMRQIAKRRGYKLNEYGLFKIEDNTRIIVKSERDLFKKVGLKWIDPENR
jgi:DNA polymerase/3'-5' exonuclease PolX